MSSQGCSDYTRLAQVKGGENISKYIEHGGMRVIFDAAADTKLLDG